MNGLRMPNVNNVLLSGRLTRDPELRYTQSGVPVVNMRIASNHYWRAGDGEWKKDTTFTDIVAWQGLAERSFERLKKGSPVFVVGRLNSSEWENAAGEKRSSLEVRADSVQFLERTGDEETAEETPAEVEV
jgi:single-strand DNA-binding protein